MSQAHCIGSGANMDFRGSIATNEDAALESVIHFIRDPSVALPYTLSPCRSSTEHLHHAIQDDDV